MKKEKVDYEKIRDQFLCELEQIEKSAQDEAVCIETCLKICFDNLNLLKEKVAGQPFGDTATEIRFFKSVKPVVISRYIYYGKRLHLFLNTAVMDKEVLKAHYKQVVSQARQFLVDNKHLYDYHLTGNTIHDEAYFVRAQPHQSIYQDINYLINPDFTTSMDSKLAEILASKLLIDCVEKKLALLRELECRGDGSLVPVLPCTATVSQVVEFVRALFVAGIFGPRKVEEVMDRFGTFLQVDLSNHAIITNQFRSRKISKTKFLDWMREGLNGYFDNLDDKLD